MKDGNCHPTKVTLTAVDRDRIFFPDPWDDTGKRIYKHAVYAEARLYCSTCPVASTCYTYAQTNYIHHGMWGGISPRRRKTHGGLEEAS